MTKTPQEEMIARQRELDRAILRLQRLERAKWLAVARLMKHLAQGWKSSEEV